MKQWLWEKTAEKCIKNLKKHRFDAYFAPSLEEAGKIVETMIGDYRSFGFGGSATIRGMGLIEKLEQAGKEIFDHQRDGFSLEESLEVRRAQGSCDCFMCSANAISATGEIVNIDGIGNRTNAMTFGPQKVIVVAGMNKVTPDLESALKRVKNVAAPMRAKSLGMDTPCVETGTCHDCNAPMRICTITSILHRKPMLTDISVILVNEELGY